MAMYLFASRLSSAVWARKSPAKSDVKRRDRQESLPGPSDAAAAVEDTAVTTGQRRAEREGLGRHTGELLVEQRDMEQRDMERRIVDPLETRELLVEDCRTGVRETPEGDLLRNAATRASVGACGRSHPCAGLPTATRRRVRFANTFPRVNRKKVSKYCKVKS